MRGKLRVSLATLSIVLVIAILPIAAATAKPPMTLAVRSTWDADMINSDSVPYTGKGVYVAVLDTGLVPNWRDFFPPERIATQLGKGFVEPVHVDPQTGELVYAGFVHETSFIGSVDSSHGTHVTSTIIGYDYYAPADAASGYVLPRIHVRGIAPDVTIIPVKVLTTYNLPGYFEGKDVVFGTDRAVAAGINYATELKLEGYGPMIITMSLGAPEPSGMIEQAINYAIANGVIVVVAAGNSGNQGMDWPGAYPQVISVGASGWRYEWYKPATPPPPRYRLWWLQDPTYGFRDIPEPTPAGDVYITDFSGRQKAGQELDVVAPGSWVRGPFESGPGYSHLPWWSSGEAWAHSRSGLTNFFYLGGTSMATPHVTAVAALMLEVKPMLTQSEVESVLRSTALPIPPGSMLVYDISPAPGFYTFSWGTNATGAGLVQADAALAAIGGVIISP